MARSVAAGGTFVDGAWRLLPADLRKANLADINLSGADIRLYPDREADYDPMTSRVLDLISAWSWAGRVPLEIARQQRVDPERHACKQTRAALS